MANKLFLTIAALILFVNIVAAPELLDYPLPDPPRLAYVSSGDPYLDSEWLKVKSFYPNEWHFVNGIKFGLDAFAALAWVHSFVETDVIYVSENYYLDSLDTRLETDWAAILVHELRHIVQNQWGMGHPSPLKELDAEAHANYFRLLNVLEKN